MIYGLTGGIATGKSTILKYLKKIGYNTLDLDEIAHNILLLNSVKKEILEKIDKNILDENNNINRKKLGSIVFKDKNKLNLLNNIMHKIILNEMKKIINKNRIENTNLVIEVPLLFELNLEKYFDKIILSYSSKETQLKRIIERDNKTNEEALDILNSQINIDEKINRSDIIINSELDFNELHKQLEKEFKNENK